MAESTEMVELLGGRSKKSSDSEYSWRCLCCNFFNLGFPFWRASGCVDLYHMNIFNRSLGIFVRGKVK